MCISSHGQENYYPFCDFLDQEVHHSVCNWLEWAEPQTDAHHLSACNYLLLDLVNVIWHLCSRFWTVSFQPILTWTATVTSGSIPTYPRYHPLRFNSHISHYLESTLLVTLFLYLSTILSSSASESSIFIVELPSLQWLASPFVGKSYQADGTMSLEEKRRKEGRN